MTFMVLQLRDLSPRCKTREHSDQSEIKHYLMYYRNLRVNQIVCVNNHVQLVAKYPEARRLRFLSERVLQAPAHRVHLHTLVPSSRVSPHRRLLQPKDGHLERRLRLF